MEKLPSLINKSLINPMPNTEVLSPEKLEQLAPMYPPIGQMLSAAPEDHKRFVTGFMKTMYMQNPREMPPERKISRAQMEVIATQVSLDTK